MRKLVIGKFYPPTLGHQYLIDFANNFGHKDELVVFVAGLKSENIDTKDRYRIIRNHYAQNKNINVVWNDLDMPQNPSEHSDFWNVWKNYIEKNCGKFYSDDILFASESYGEPLSKVLGMQFIPVDIKREIFKVSGTQVRETPSAYFDSLMYGTKELFMKSYAIVGPESSGKSTLSKNFEHLYNVVPEFARGFLMEKGPKNITKETMMQIALGQTSSFNSVHNMRTNQVTIEDTPVLMTYIWWQLYLPNEPIPDLLELLVRRETRDMWFLLKDNIPFEKDILREEHGRICSFELVEKTLQKFNKPYMIIHENKAYERFMAVLDFIEKDLEKLNNV